MPHQRAGDLEVFYRQWQGEGDEPLVLVHGNWSTHRWWIPTAEALLKLEAGRARFGEILAIDMRGRGDTRGPDNDYTIPALAEDLRAFIAARELGPRLHLVGHSLGSAVAMQFALEHRERLASLCVVSPAWVDGMPEAWNRPELQRVTQDDIERFASVLAPMAPTAPRDAFWRELVETGHRQRWAATLHNLDALVNWKPGDALKQLTMARMVVEGEQDPLCGGETARRAAEALGARRVRMAGVGHSPNLEVPARFAALLVELAEIAAEG
ncbi:alpha/beta hydrolase [Pseudenhygromyxa sp. WMMC2535]|uniref:alpha/beta fold hydrolase n=1 Tax=Pseudenhygromyxa sp. WMMC2535 TaxID=2712867 RepID=UPI001556BEF3|nr:alpha/beta hydrolase [Pseudenhygromyxa sp. WMMC2535]